MNRYNKVKLEVVHQSNFFQSFNLILEFFLLSKKSKLLRCKNKISTSEIVRIIRAGHLDYMYYIRNYNVSYVLPQLGLRDNDLLELPREIGELTRIRELHIQNNRLTVLPPEIASLDLLGQKSVLKMEENPWVTAIAEQYLIGISHVLEYIKTEAYRM